MTRKQTGYPPIYGTAMLRVLRTPLTDGHWAQLTLAATMTGKSRAALVREGIERVTAEIISHPTTPAQRNGARDESRTAQKSEAPDHAAL
jgi:hypothetical protein